MGISDEFWPAIVDSIPNLVALLMHSDSDVCSAGADTLVRLSEKGKQKSRLFDCITPLIGIADVFRPAIVDCFPKLVALLTVSDKRVRLTGANALAKLSGLGK
jgi:hypothetical protein